MVHCGTFSVLGLKLRDGFLLNVCVSFNRTYYTTIVLHYITLHRITPADLRGTYPLRIFEAFYSFSISLQQIEENNHDTIDTTIYEFIPTNMGNKNIKKKSSIEVSSDSISEVNVGDVSVSRLRVRELAVKIKEEQKRNLKRQSCIGACDFPFSQK